MGNAESPQLRAEINQFATRCFRDMADGDYIVARLAHRHTLVPQFLWSSLQAIEKYLKAILLFNRVRSTRATHGLLGLVEKVEGVQGLRFRVSKNTRRFLEYLDNYGRFRYLEISYHSSGLHVVALDRAVWEIRRYCDVLDYEVSKSGGQATRMLDRELKRIELSEDDPGSFVWFNGELEGIIRDRKHPARSALVWKNFCFASRMRAKLPMADWSVSVNSPLALHPEILREIKQYVFLPKDVVVAFEALLLKRHPSP